MFYLMSASRSALGALLLLLAVACGDASVLPVAPAAAPAVPLASIRLVDRLDEDSAAAVPDVTGETVADAKKRLGDLTVNVVDFGRRGEAISAQWPAPGEPRPADGGIVVWVGTPPEPPRARRASAPAAEPGEPTATQPSAAPTPAETLPIPGSGPVAEATPPAPPPATGITPGLENLGEPVHGPRANIRTMAPAKSGSAFAGRASWYGPGFAGRGTACGTTFDPTELTLASRELRCGTKVRVTGPAGSVQATVTDWGPAEWTKRRFDLSQATFSAVAPLGSGVIDVTVTVP